MAAVTAAVRTLPGALAIVKHKATSSEEDTATATKLVTMLLINMAGTKLSAPTKRSVDAAVLDYGPRISRMSSLRVNITAANGSASWPLCAFVYAVMAPHTMGITAATLLFDTLLQFQFSDAMSKAQTTLGYAPLPSKFKNDLLAHLSAVKFGGF